MYIMATSFSGGGSRNTRREPSTMGKQLVTFITCGCQSSAPFLVIDKAGENSHVWVIGLYELLILANLFRPFGFLALKDHLII
jgi:hypothetical protein